MVPRAEPELDALLSQARADYTKSLPSKVTRIAELARRLAWSEVRVLAHQLRGSAGTWGFTELGSAAGKLEDILVDCDESPGDLARANFEDTLRQAALCAEQALRSAS